MANVQRGRSFGDYEIQRKLGRGGMASVFQAVHKVTGQEVALKILHDHYADDLHIRTRFVHEAQIVSQLSHPNIVPIWDIGEHKHRPFIVMPYMEGGSIAETFTVPGPLSHQTALQVLGLLASALDYAHSKEVIHRDFKLENILLTADHNPAIGDFGIAQSANTTRITMTGQILGSPLYMAPENFDEAYDIDYRVDLYSFAVSAYVLFTGYFPFTGKDTIAIILKQRNEEAPRPSIVNPELPSALDGIFSKALAKNPNQRFDLAQDLVESLHIAFYDKPDGSSMIFLNSANPRSTRTPTPAPHSPTYFEEPKQAERGMNYALQQYQETMPNVAIDDPERKKSKKGILPIALIGLFFLCAGISFVVFSLNSGFLLGTLDSSETTLADEGSIELISDNLTTPTETSTATSSPTLTATPTVTYTPTITYTPSPTSTGTITATYTPTITRTPTATPRILPSSTATATTIVTATSQPQSTNSSGGAPRPTNTRRPPTHTPTNTPTNTPRPTNTRTPLPTNTRTPLPTNTPVPPTNTPVPPTNTPVPPTDVPPTDPPPPTDVPPTEPPPPTDLPPPTDPPPPPTEPPPPPTEPPQGEEEQGEGGGG